MELQSLFQLVIVYLILYVLCRIFFALFERTKKEKKEKKKPQKNALANKKVVKQNLIGKKEALRLEQQETEKEPNPVAYNYKADSVNSIDRYVEESKEFAKLEQQRQEAAESLQPARMKNSEVDRRMSDIPRQASSAHPQRQYASRNFQQAERARQMQKANALLQEYNALPVEMQRYVASKHNINTLR